MFCREIRPMAYHNVFVDYQRPASFDPSARSHLDPLALIAFVLGLFSIAPAIAIAVYGIFAMMQSISRGTHLGTSSVFLLAWLPGLVPVALGILSIVRIARSQGRRRGLWLAIPAIITGLVEPPLGVFLVFCFLILMARSVPHCYPIHRWCGRPHQSSPI